MVEVNPTHYYLNNTWHVETALIERLLRGRPSDRGAQLPLAAGMPGVLDRSAPVSLSSALSSRMSSPLFNSSASVKVAVSACWWPQNCMQRGGVRGGGAGVRVRGRGTAGRARVAASACWRP